MESQHVLLTCFPSPEKRLGSATWQRSVFMTHTSWMFPNTLPFSCSLTNICIDIFSSCWRTDVYFLFLNTSKCQQPAVWHFCACSYKRQASEIRRYSWNLREEKSSLWRQQLLGNWTEIRCETSSNRLRQLRMSHLVSRWLFISTSHLNL